MECIYKKLRKQKCFSRHLRKEIKQIQKNIVGIQDEITFIQNKITSIQTDVTTIETQMLTQDGAITDLNLKTQHITAAPTPALPNDDFTKIESSQTLLQGSSTTTETSTLEVTPTQVSQIANYSNTSVSDQGLTTLITIESDMVCNASGIFPGNQLSTSRVREVDGELQRDSFATIGTVVDREDDGLASVGCVAGNGFQQSSMFIDTTLGVIIRNDSFDSGSVIAAIPGGSTIPGEIVMRIFGQDVAHGEINLFFDESGKTTMDVIASTVAFENDTFGVFGVEPAVQQFPVAIHETLQDQINAIVAGLQSYGLFGENRMLLRERKLPNNRQLDNFKRVTETNCETSHDLLIKEK